MSGPVLLPEYFLRVSRSHADHIYCQIVDATSAKLTFKSKTWAQLIQDASIAAHRLVELGMPIRQPGDPSFNIAIRVRDSYAAFVAVLGIWLNRWTVSFFSQF